MSERADARLVRRCAAVATASSVFVVATGLTALAGWTLYLAPLFTWGSATAMVPNTAAASVLAGLSLWLFRKQGGQAPASGRQLMATTASVSSGLIGALSLAEVLVHLDFGIDRLLLVRVPTLLTVAYPPRMSPITASIFVLLSLSLLTIDRRTLRLDWPAQFFALVAMIAAAFGSISILVVPGASPLSLSVPTALVGLFLPVGIVCARAPWAVGGLLTSDTRGARLLRKTVPAALFVLSLVGWSLSRPLLTGTRISVAAVTLLALFCSVLLASFIVWIASIVDHDEIELRKIEQAQQLSPEQLDRLLNRIEEPADDAHLRRRVTAGLTFAILLTGLLGFFSLRAARQAAATAEWVAHTHEVMTELERALRHSLDVETGGRGFAETGSVKFLEPYESGRPAVAQDVHALRVLLTAPDQQQLLNLLAEQANDQVNDVEVIVATRQNGGKIPTAAVFEQGKHDMDAVRLTIEQMEVVQRGLLALSTQSARAAQHSSTVVIALGSLLGVLFLTVAGGMVKREIGVSARARGQVKALNADLELRVEQRTAALQSEVAVRKRTEEMRERLAAIVEFSDDAIISKTLDGTISAWNRGAEKVFGYTAAEMVGQSILLLLPPHRIDEELDILARIKRGQSVEHFETVRVRKDGARIDVSVTISPIRDGNGVIIGASKVARDITERKLKEEAMRESEERFHTMANGIQQLAWMAQADGSIFWYNQRWYDYTGTTLEESKGWTWETMHDPAFLPRVLDQWKEAIATGTPFDMEFPLRGADGLFRTFLTRVMPLRDSGGRVVRWLGTNTDITDRKQAEEHLARLVVTLAQQAEDLSHSRGDLEAQTSMLKLILESMGEGLIAADHEGHFLLWNDAANALMGRSAADMPTEQWTPHYDVFLADGITPYPADRLPLVRALRGESVLAELMIQPPEPEPGRFIEVTARPLKDAQGNLRGGVAVLHDITERKRSEAGLAQQAEELRRSRQASEAQAVMLQTVLDSMVEGLVAADKDGNFILWNPAAERIMGLGAANLPSTEWSAHYGLYMPDTVTPIPPGETPLERTLQGETVSTEIFLRHAGVDHGLWLETNGSPLIAKDGSVRGGVLAFRDISRRKADELEILKLNLDLEERIAKRTEQLAATNHELESFSYSVSHDLRAPLRHIAGFSRILMNDFGPGMALEGREHLQRIENAVGRMELLVDGLLSLAKLGQQSLKLCGTELNAVVDTTILILEPECQGRDVEWRVGKLPALNCDPILMAQVFQNLLGNALKYSRGRTKAVIEVDSIQQADNPAIIFVRDNGAGFDPRYVKKMFGVFQRFHTTSEFEGTGVGLATVHRIIQKHGGTIWAESEPDHGATFYFALQMTQHIGTSAKAMAAS